MALSYCWFCGFAYWVCTSCCCLLLPSCCVPPFLVIQVKEKLLSARNFYFYLISVPVLHASIRALQAIKLVCSYLLRLRCWPLPLLCCFSPAASTAAWKPTVKTEKKTVQFSEDIQVETIEPEQEPVYIDEVSALLCALSYSDHSDLLRSQVATVNKKISSSIR